MSTAVLVPGACHGGWWYDPVVDGLAAVGVSARALTLTGLGPEGMTGLGQVNLDTHVEETVAAVTGAAQESGQPVVLVGHSYGGCVVTATADRVPEHVGALVVLDGFVPADGDSCWSMTNDDQRAWYIAGSAQDGLTLEPLPFFAEQARPHPLATLLQRSRLTGAWTQVPSKTYVVATDWPGGEAGSPLTPTARRLEADRGWDVQRWRTRHNVLHDGPERVVELLRGLAVGAGRD